VIRPVPAPVPPQRSPTPPKPIAAKPAPDPAPVTHKITPSYTPVAPSRSSSRSTDTPAQTRAAELAASQAAAREAAGRRAQEAAVATALAGLDSSIRGREIPVTVAALPGDGGGEAFASYDTAVCTVYYNAWRPEDPARKVAAPVVKIVVSRNGNVTSSAFVSKSGDPLLDRSVQRALDAVKELPPFPPTSTDTERSFVITFNPEAKQSAG
jgi:TonB family protein